jgi:hypothetical protein
MLWLLVAGAILGGVLILTTQGLLHALGGGLSGACTVLAVQVWLERRRANRASPK